MAMTNGVVRYRLSQGFYFINVYISLYSSISKKDHNCESCIIDICLCSKNKLIIGYLFGNIFIMLIYFNNRDLTIVIL